MFSFSFFIRVLNDTAETHSIYTAIRLVNVGIIMLVAMAALSLLGSCRTCRDARCRHSRYVPVATLDVVIVATLLPRR